MTLTLHRPIPVLLVCFWLSGLVGCVGASWPEVEDNLDISPRDRNQTAVAFASCLHERRAAPIFQPLLEANPDLLVMMGDNAYIDLPERPRRAADFRRAYRRLAQQPYWQAVTQRIPVLATWDDHDYGYNDAGRRWRLKETAKQEFMNFFGVPLDARMRGHAGVYSAVTVGPPGRRLQIILLDTRTFRGDLSKKIAAGLRRGGPYRPTNDRNRPLLGEAQWRWLEAALRRPAEVRLVVSSIQVVSREHGWECWGNFPHELQRLYGLIEDTRARGVIFLSGDRHQAEISADRDPIVPYPLYDITSSGLNQRERSVSEPNRYRVGELHRRSHFGLLRIDWSRPGPMVRVELVGEQGEVFESTEIDAGQLRVPGAAPPDRRRLFGIFDLPQ